MPLSSFLTSVCKGWRDLSEMKVYQLYDGSALQLDMQFKLLEQNLPVRIIIGNLIEIYEYMDYRLLYVLKMK